MKSRTPFVYTGRHTAEISFPLGGIGTGCLGLAGNGRLVDWEIFNKPNKGGLNGFSHFAIKAERDGQVVDARVLQGDLPGPYMGTRGPGHYTGYGFGPDRATMAGLPHFRDVTFRGEFPVATLTFTEPKFPGAVTLTAFNPLIPLNDVDSSIPSACFEFTVRNPTDTELVYTVAGTLKNAHGEKSTNRLVQAEGMTCVRLGRDDLPATDLGYGELCLGTDASVVSAQEYWFRGAWFDNLGVWWRDFTAAGPLPPRSYPPATGKGADHASLAARLTVAAGASATVRFVLTWHYPNMTNYWNPMKPAVCGTGPAACDCGPAANWQNYYATRFADALASARYSLQQWPRLLGETRAFKDALFASTLPPEVLDAVSANISILKTPTVLRLTDGSFYGFEGCHQGAGCCEGSCQHVWSYAYALPFLFPALERSMRALEYGHSQRPDGGLPFRLQLPLGRELSGFRPCADGQFGTIIKMYREWKISGDNAWLRQWWPAIKRSLEFAWASTNEDQWDPQQTGVLWGRQHHTLDMELFGPNAWLTGFYLGALKAGAEMADAMGEPGAATTYRAIFARGKTWVDTHLFNGEYYHQQVELGNREVLAPFATPAGGSMVGDLYTSYWDAEHGELKYQVGEGCGIDQVLAQWHANLCGLGELFDPAQTRSALRAIYRHNFKPSLRDFANFCRLYGMNDEAGTVMFDWPAGKRKPVVPVPYAEETMHGFEYQAACHLIQEGMVREGLQMVRAVRDRYDGAVRNPWNEIECGSNYARSMASYALLNALSGFRFDATCGLIGFNPPRRPKSGFRCFWSLAAGWGEVEITPTQTVLRVCRGTLPVATLALPYLRRSKDLTLAVGAQPLAVTRQGGELRLATAITLAAGQELVVRHP